MAVHGASCSWGKSDVAPIIAFEQKADDQGLGYDLELKSRAQIEGGLLLWGRARSWTKGSRSRQEIHCRRYQAQVLQQIHAYKHQMKPRIMSHWQKYDEVWARKPSQVASLHTCSFLARLCGIASLSNATRRADSMTSPASPGNKDRAIEEGWRKQVTKVIAHVDLDAFYTQAWLQLFPAIPANGAQYHTASRQLLKAGIQNTFEIIENTMWLDSVLWSLAGQISKHCMISVFQ